MKFRKRSAISVLWSTADFPEKKPFFCQNKNTKQKIKITGNPVRNDVVDINGKREEGFEFYELNPTKKTILIIGGSLGARTLNQSMLSHYKTIQESDFQVLWQTGKLYFDALTQQLGNNKDKTIKIVQFIDRMDLAYAIADVIISRAGAISISELCLIGKPVILVPSQIGRAHV